jgi:outer membrane lipoprotein
MKRWIIIMMGIFLFFGCAHVISKDTLGKVDLGVTFTELRENLLRYQGGVFLLGGVIVETHIVKEGTLLEIYQTQVDRQGRPKNLDRSEGRFMAYYTGFLDSEIWSKGREVTLAGTLEGEKTQKLGEIDYQYPYLRVSEIHLWKKPYYQVDPYPLRPWRGPWWGSYGYPYWDGYYPYYPYWWRYR